MQILFEPNNKPSYEYPNQYFHFRISWKNQDVYKRQVRMRHCGSCRNYTKRSWWPIREQMPECCLLLLQRKSPEWGILAEEWICENRERSAKCQLDRFLSQRTYILCIFFYDNRTNPISLYLSLIHISYPIMYVPIRYVVRLWTAYRPNFLSSLFNQFNDNLSLYCLLYTSRCV